VFVLFCLLFYLVVCCCVVRYACDLFVICISVGFAGFRFVVDVDCVLVYLLFVNWLLIFFVVLLNTVCGGWFGLCYCRFICFSLFWLFLIVLRLFIVVI